MSGFTIKHRDELESMEGSGKTTWRLLRRGLGIGDFGLNLVEIGPGGQLPEHDEARSGQVEVFGILEGEGTFRLDGQEHRAPAGTFVRLSPEVRRTITNQSSAPLLALLIGVSPDRSYRPPEWA